MLDIIVATASRARRQTDLLMRVSSAIRPFRQHIYLTHQAGCSTNRQGCIAFPRPCLARFAAFLSLSLAYRLSARQNWESGVRLMSNACQMGGLFPRTCAPGPRDLGFVLASWKDDTRRGDLQ